MSKRKQMDDVEITIYPGREFQCPSLDDYDRDLDRYANGKPTPIYFLRRPCDLRLTSASDKTIAERINLRKEN